jgi:hypothetical protein
MPETVLKQLDTVTRQELYALFDSEDFLYRTVTPCILDGSAIDALIDEQTRFIALAGDVVGLWSFRSLDPQNWGFSRISGFYQLGYRLRSDLSPSWWVQGFEAILGYLTSKSDVIRIAIEIPEFDHLGVTMATAMGFALEGVVAETIALDGRLWGTATYARTWRPS